MTNFLMPSDVIPRYQSPVCPRVHSLVEALNAPMVPSATVSHSCRSDVFLNPAFHNVTEYHHVSFAVQYLYCVLSRFNTSHVFTFSGYRTCSHPRYPIGPLMHCDTVHICLFSVLQHPCFPMSRALKQSSFPPVVIGSYSTVQFNPS